MIQNIINHKIYIGKSNNPEYRFQHHKAIAAKGKTIGRATFNLLHKAIAKYGKNNFKLSIIEEFENEQDSLDAEIFWIDYFGSNVSKYGNDCGYNLTDGGEGVSGLKHTEETKQKISFASKTKIIWPPNDELIQLVNTIGLRASGRLLGVADTAVSGRLKRHNLFYKIKTKLGRRKQSAK